MTHNESLRSIIALTRIKGIGLSLAKTLIAYLGSPEQIFTAKKQVFLKIPNIGEVLANFLVSQRDDALRRADSELAFVQKHKIRLLTFFDADYPFRLKECPDAPLVLFQKGDFDFNKGRFLAVVGTRKPSERAKELCDNLVLNLARNVSDLNIVSGLAFGVDALAHKSSLNLSCNTVAVLGHGLDRIYPSLHRPLAKRIIHQGCLLTDFLSETKPDKSNFVRRNRIIAGLCDATVVVESKQTGGALITADFANDYNRDVFAFPGRVDDECSKGCNALIKTNRAMLIESADDLMAAMNWSLQEKKTQNDAQLPIFCALSDDEQELLMFLRQHPEGMQANELAVCLSKPFSEVSSLLLGLEFKNMLRCLPGNLYRNLG